MIRRGLTARAEAFDNSASDGAEQLPDSIQWMPPGRQVVTPLVNGSPTTVTVDVTPGLAGMFNRQLHEMRAEAAAGRGDEPYIDFNHDDRERAGAVTDLYWAGDDPKTGGIRIKVNWSEAGRRAVAGKNYRRFSPEWQLDPKTKAPIGITENLGGLVNRAAFKNISTVTAKGGTATGATDRMNQIVALAQEEALQKKIPYGRALAAAVSANSDVYKDCMDSLSSRREPVVKNVHWGAAPHNADARQCLEEAQDFAKEQGVPLSTAMFRLASSNPEWERRYRASLRAPRTMQS